MPKAKDHKSKIPRRKKRNPVTVTVTNTQSNQYREVLKNYGLRLEGVVVKSPEKEEEDEKKGS